MNSKSLRERVIELFSTTEEKFMDIKTQEGKILRIEGETLVEGITIQEVSEDGLIVLENGTYITEDNKSVVVEEGMIKSIEDVVEDTDMPNEDDSVSTEEVITTASFELEVGSEIFIMGEDAPMKVEGAKIITTDANGVVVSIEVIEAPVEVEVETEEFSAMKIELEALRKQVEEFKALPSATPTVIEDFKATTMSKPKSKLHSMLNN